MVEPKHHDWDAFLMLHFSVFNFYCLQAEIFLLKNRFMMFFNEEVKPQLVKSLAIIICAHVLTVYNNYASTLIIYKVNRNFSFLPIIYFP